MLFTDTGAYTLERGQLIARGTERDRWRAGGLELDCVRPLQQWTLRYTGRLQRAGEARGEGDGTGVTLRCSLDLTFLAEAEPFSPGRDDDAELLAHHLGAATWDTQLLRQVRRVQNQGYVQLGTVHGSVALGESVLPLRAACLRQHTWGVRDWGASDFAFQCFVALDSGQRAWVHHARFPFVTLEGGFIAKDGDCRPIRGLGHTLERHPHPAPRRVSLSIAHADGALEFEAKLRSHVVLTVDGRGEIVVGFFDAGEGIGRGVWAGQRRVLPRAAP
jgi:hypothetical protein